MNLNEIGRDEPRATHAGRAGGRVSLGARSAFRAEVDGLLDELAELLETKNRRYGDSALEPLGVFSKLPAEEALRVRLDDKLKRIRAGAADDDEDPILDLVGYGVLLLLARRRARAEKETPDAR